MKSVLHRSDTPVARGFIPVEQRSSPQTCNPISPGIPSVLGLRLLRSRAGINPLATGNLIATADGGAGGASGGATLGATRHDQSGADPAGGLIMKPVLHRSDTPVARGFIPVGQRSSPKICNPISPGIPSVLGLRLLRSRAGINPLATGNCTATGNPIATENSGDCER